MKRLFWAVVLVALMCGGAWADVEINSTNFPDDTFRSYVSSTFDTDSNGALSESEIASAANIYVGNSGISSLQGLEYFTALTHLECNGNSLTALDVSKNTNLNALVCNGNQLSSLNLNSNTALAELHCEGNRLTALDLSRNTALQVLYCSKNQLTALDVSRNASLTTLDCSGNQLAALDVSHNPALHTLVCDVNRLTALDVSVNESLQALTCTGNQLRTLDIGSKPSLTSLTYSSQDVSTSVSLTETGNTSYPYQLDLNSYMTSAQIANVSGVQGFDSNGSNITTIYSNGIAQFTARPANVRYSYSTGYNSETMSVTLAFGNASPTPVTPDNPVPPSHDARILELLSLGYLDSSYRPIVTFDGDGSDFTGTVKQGEVITRTLSLRFSAQTWNLYINSEQFSVSLGNRGTVETTALADGVTITTNADGTSATITLDTKEFPSGSSNIELGVLPEGGTEETARAGLGTITVSAPDVIEQAVITPVVLSDEVVQRLAQSVSVDVREINMLTSADIDSREAPEPTQAMKEFAQSESYELAAKLNTITVDKEGWYAFVVTVSDDLVGTPVSDLRIYGAEESDFSGSFRAAFGILPLINGIAGGFEVHNLLGIKLDSLPKQFIALMFLNASKSLTLYIAKILLMLLAGCASVSGIGLVVVVGMFAVRHFRKRR